ncbi:MAG: N-formylglutamate amidohydrolase, partial [Nitrosopumilaceae archaeon]|nr:N-formylglutamate amidohydrolase [Nitrosopumilaceae archaeon]NIU86850.1 N-formylglutamate amidohydrolase [Nitrosopumilaceae archaeon]NIV66836.1 N-formylglutamate amidohydrolase [Nitrosopumilaceae archaeon]
MSKLPFLISIPHGGTNTPPELNEIACIGKKDLFDDSDPFVIE